MRLIKTDRKPVSRDVTTVRKISTLDHCKGKKQWEPQGPGRVDGVNINHARPQ